MHFLADFIKVLSKPMALFGVIGQLVFFSRFLVQWIISEKEKKSTIPLAFWYLSIIGAVLTFVYAVWRKDPIFSISQLVGLIVYSRNLVLIRQHSRNMAQEYD